MFTNRTWSLALIALSTTLGFSVPAGAQLGHKRTLEEDPLEFLSDPPAPKVEHKTSSPLVIPMAGFISYQINVNSNGQNVIGDAANEPSMTVDPLNPNRIAVGWRQFDNVASNFRQAGNAYSTNHGANWTFPGVLTPGLFRSDPVLDTTKSGMFHYNSLQNTFFSDEFRSSNWGQTYPVVNGATGGDKQWITIDKTNGSGSGFVYQYWSTAGNNWGGRQFSRSIDGGANWMDPINIPNQPIWGTLDVDNSGNMWLGGVSTTDASFWVMRSSNAKNSAVTPTFDLVKNVSLGGDISWNPPVNPVGLGGQVWVAADKSGNGNIYLCSTTDRTSTNPADVMFIRSTDGGTTFSAPKRINTDATSQTHYHWFGTMQVAPNGRIDICWLDTRNDPGKRFSQLMYSYSSDGGVTFSPNTVITPAFNPNIGYPNQNKIGDYMAMTSDDLGANIVYPATFNNEQDIYYVRVEIAPQQVVPTAYSVLRGTPVSGDLASLLQDDGNYLVGSRGFVANFGEAPLQYVVEGVSGLLSPSDMTFKAVAKANNNVMQQETSLYNWVSGQYELLDTRLLANSDSTTLVATTGARSRFVDQSTGKIRAKLAYRQTGFVPTFWNVSIDQLNWTVTP